MAVRLVSRELRATAWLPTAMVWAAVALCGATAGAQAPQGSLADRFKAVQSGQADSKVALVLPAWRPVSPGATAPAIPIVKGLKVVLAVTDPAGDFESIKTVEDVDATTVRLHISADLPAPKLGSLLRGGAEGVADARNQSPHKVECLRIVDVADLAKAHSFSEMFCGGNKVEHFPQSTAMSASTEMLNQLRDGQAVEFHFAPDNNFAAFIQLGAQVEGKKSGQASLTPHAGQQMYSCSLHRVGAGDVAVPVLLNGRRIELPALHAMCTLDNTEEVHAYYLDQPTNPLTLAFQSGALVERGQVIQIVVPEAAKSAAADAAGSPMEQALAAKKPVDVYGIYFDFNSATIKPESEAVLREIADIMRKNSDWTLSVGGHTDNIGGDPANLALSQRRAAAVKDALVARYRIAPGRLTTSGYGASVPVESNTTLEGRARNRRVELRRQ